MKRSSYCTASDRKWEQGLISMIIICLVLVGVTGASEEASKQQVDSGRTELVENSSSTFPPYQLAIC